MPFLSPFDHFSATKFAIGVQIVGNEAHSRALKIKRQCVGYICSVQSGNLAQSADCTVQSADCTVAVQSADCMPCSLQTARGPFMHVCALER